MKYFKILVLSLTIAFTFACTNPDNNTQSNSIDNGNQIVENLPPVISLTKNGVDVGFTNSITFNTSSLATADDYSLNLSSTAQGGITNFFVTISSDNTNLSSILNNLSNVDIANLDSSLSIIVAPMVPNYNNIKGSNDINISINSIIATISNAITDNTTISLSMRLVDANGSDSDTLNASLVKGGTTITPVTNPPTALLLQNGSNIGFNNSLIFDAENTSTASNYSLNLLSTAQGGISEFRITVTPQDSSLANLFSDINNIDIANSGTFSSVAEKYIANYASVKGSDNISISINKILSQIGTLITDDETFTISVELVDADGRFSDSFATTIYKVTTPTIVDVNISVTNGGSALATQSLSTTHTKLSSTSASNEIELSLSTTEPDGINRLILSVTTDNDSANTALNTKYPLGIDLFDQGVIQELSNLGINLPAINGETNINIPLNALLISILNSARDIANNREMQLILNIQAGNVTKVVNYKLEIDVSEIVLNINDIKVYPITNNDTRIDDYTQSGLYSVLSYIPENIDSNASLGAIVTVTRPSLNTSHINSNTDISVQLSDGDVGYNRLPVFNDFRQQEYEMLNELGKQSEQGVQQRNISFNIEPKIYEIGDTWDNVVIFPTGDTRSPSTISAKTVYESQNAYYMQQTGSGVPMLSQAQLEAYATEFEVKYTDMIDTFARPNDVDSNGKIIIMFTRFSLSGLLGYFYSGDKSSNAPYSNEADIFYINLDWAIDDTRRETIMGTLVHELQHMLLYDQRSRISSFGEDDTWLNEGLSMLSELIYGYNVTGDVSYFLRYSHNLGLLDWTSYNYGYSLVFTAYLYDRFGGKDFIRKIYDTKNRGVAAIESTTGLKFNDIFKDFLIAVGTTTIIPYNSVADNRYKISGIDLSSHSSGIFKGLLSTSTLSASTTTNNPIMMPYSIVSRYWQGDVATVTSDNLTGIAFPYNP